MRTSFWSHPRVAIQGTALFDASHLASFFSLRGGHFLMTPPHVSSKILRPNGKGKNKSLLSNITMTLRLHDDLQTLHNQFVLAQYFPSVRFLGSYWPRSSDRFLLMLVGIKSKISFCPPSLLKPSINNRC